MTTEPQRSPLPVWVVIIAALGAFLFGAGAVIALVNPAMLVSKDAVINDAVKVYAGYMASRNLAIAAMILAALLLRARGVLRVSLLLAGSIQLLDAFIDCMERRWAVAPGVTVLGIVFLIAAARASTKPLLAISSWRDGL